LARVSVAARQGRGHTTVAAVLMTRRMTAAVIAPLAWLAVVLRVELTTPGTRLRRCHPDQVPPRG